MGASESQPESSSSCSSGSARSSEDPRTWSFERRPEEELASSGSDGAAMRGAVLLDGEEALQAGAVDDEAIDQLLDVAARAAAEAAGSVVGDMAAEKSQNELEARKMLFTGRSGEVEKDVAAGEA